MKLLLAGTISFSLASILMPFVILIAKRFSIYDKRDSRHLSSEIKLRFGGAAVVFAFFITLLFFSTSNALILSIYIGGLLITLIGGIDDIFNTKPLQKLLLVSIAAVVPVLFGIRLEWINFFGRTFIFGIWSIPITIVWIVILTNAMNIIDGLDGLTGGISVISSLTLVLTALIISESEIAVISAILCGACLGFLPYNIFPFRTKITLGDTGALFIGYIFAILSIDGLFKMSTTVSYLIPAILFSLPISDVLVSAVRRHRNGVKVTEGDRGHLHYRLADSKLGQGGAVAFLCFLTGINSVGAVLITLGKIVYGFAIIIFSASSLCLIYYYIKPKD